MGITLYDLTEGMQKIQAIIEGGDDPELWKDQLEDIDEQIEEKIISIGRVYRNKVSEAQIYIDESKRLAEKGKAMQNGAERLREYAEVNMSIAGLTEIQDGTLVAKFQKLPDKVGQIDDVSALPDEFKRVVPETIEADKKAILEAYKKTGVVSAGVDIETGRTTLKFK